MKGIIWYKENREEAIEMLVQMIKRYEEFLGVKTEKQHIANLNSWALFENGDTWKVLRASESNRGHRCNIAYVDRSIDWDSFVTIVRPKIMELPYCAIHLWGEGNLHIDDTVPLPF